ncbi:Golgi-associated RAB2 interactor protein 1A-like [Eublepharis macularius]|uniref:Golgi-associated RAB2 interactor protein 1A-like n=1 Tax=Eublepharis macularius TaxID=481883 RepID=A0AA97JSD6_EUBMA|nr:Golgi-associated RAB2 interactor protein 1A-like [Eublepharis macularius]
MASGVSAGNTAAGRKLAWEGGQLCQLLRSPDYNLFPNSAVFESDFVQVTKAGKCVDFTNMPTVVSMGVTSSDPCLPLPNVLLMARRKVLGKGFVAGNGQSSELPVLDLSRLLPLRCVKLSVHHAAQRILCLQTVTRKVYYLQLHQGYPKAVFGLWSRLADILQRGLSITAKDPAVHIRHSLVPSGSSPSSSSSGEVRRSRVRRRRRRRRLPREGPEQGGKAGGGWEGAALWAEGGGEKGGRVARAGSGAGCEARGLQGEAARSSHGRRPPWRALGLHGGGAARERPAFAPTQPPRRPLCRAVPEHGAARAASRMPRWVQPLA